MSLTAVFSPHWQQRKPTDKVLLLLHGYGSNERDLPSLTPFLPADLPWASLRAPISMGYDGYAWFPLPVDGDWTRKEPIEAATTILWEWIDAQVGADAPLAVVGFSQGGLMATQLLRTRPERVADVAVLGGFVMDAPQPADAELAATLPPVFWGRGDADRVITPGHVEGARAFLEAHTTLTERVYNGLAHGVSSEELADVKAYLNR